MKINSKENLDQFIHDYAKETYLIQHELYLQNNDLYSNLVAIATLFFTGVYYLMNTLIPIDDATALSFSIMLILFGILLYLAIKILILFFSMHLKHSDFKALPTANKIYNHMKSGLENPNIVIESNDYLRDYYIQLADTNFANNQAIREINFQIKKLVLFGYVVLGIGFFISLLIKLWR